MVPSRKNEPINTPRTSSAKTAANHSAARLFELRRRVEKFAELSLWVGDESITGPTRLRGPTMLRLSEPPGAIAGPPGGVAYSSRRISAAPPLHVKTEGVAAECPLPLACGGPIHFQSRRGNAPKLGALGFCRCRHAQLQRHPHAHDRKSADQERKPPGQ